VPGFAVVVKAGIVHGGRILVLDPSEVERHGEHDLPGGRLEYDEDPVAALHREVHEETGLTIEPVAPVRMWSYMRTDGRQMVGVTWACRLADDPAAVRLSDEHLSYHWVAREDIPAEWEERPELEMVFHVFERLAPDRPPWFDHGVVLHASNARYRPPGDTVDRRR
jgi:8-oxo-dGTP diphosphatase